MHKSNDVQRYRMVCSGLAEAAKGEWCHFDATMTWHLADKKAALAAKDVYWLEAISDLRVQHAQELAEARGEGEALIKRYRKKPIEVEAIQYDGHNGYHIERWSGRAVIGSPVLEPTDDNPTGSYLQIDTLEGVMTAIVGDWIIKGAVGEFYPCKPDAFEATFEVDDA